MRGDMDVSYAAAVKFRVALGTPVGDVIYSEVCARILPLISVLEV